MAKRIGTVETQYGVGTLMQRQYGNGAIALTVEPGICTVSVNLAHGQPCTQSDELPPGHFYVDTNNLQKPLLDALLSSGYFEKTSLPEGVSGYCSYPVWKLTEREKQAA